MTNHLLAREKWHCEACKQDCFDDERDWQCLHPGSDMEPPDYSALCPHCGSDRMIPISAFWCRTCEDEMVQHEGEQCSECRTCEDEFRCEKELDDSLEIDGEEVPF